MNYGNMSSYAGVMNQSLTEKPVEIQPLRKIGFTLLDDCQGECTYCYEREFDSMRNLRRSRIISLPVISLSEFRQIIQKAKALGLEDVQLSGGEPLIMPDICGYIRAAKVIGVKVGVFTNGVLLSKRISELKSAGVDWVRVGLGGSTARKSRIAGRIRDSDSRFRLITSGVESSLAAGIPTGLFTPVTRKNIEDIQATAKLAATIGVSYIVFCNYIQLGTRQDEDHMPSIAEHYRAIENLLDARCEQCGKVSVLAYYGFFEFLSVAWSSSDSVLRAPCGIERLAFDPRGGVKTCLCVKKPLDSFRRAGFSLSDLWRNHPELHKIRTAERQLPPCSTCPVRDVCAPCISSALNTGGNRGLNILPPQCPVVRKFNGDAV